MALTLSTEDLQYIHGYSAVVFVGHDGNPTTSGTTLRNAIGAASAGTLILVGPGTFYVGTSVLQFPSTATVRGVNRELTIVASGYVGADNSFVPGSLGSIEDLTLYNNATGHTFGLSGSEVVTNTLIRNARLLGQANLMNVVSTSASLFTLDNVIIRGTATNGIYSTSAAHEYRLTNVQALLFGSGAVAGINLSGAANLRGGLTNIELPDAVAGEAVKVAGTSQVGLYSSGLLARGATVNIAAVGAFVRLVGTEFDRTLVTGTVANLTDIATITQVERVGGMLATAQTAASATQPQVEQLFSRLTEDRAEALDLIPGLDETGDGDTEVTENTGGTDNLRFTYNGSGVDNAVVRAYLTADYTAGTYTVRGLTYTGSDGRWVRPMMLDVGAYTFTFAKDGYELAVSTATVS